MVSRRKRASHARDALDDARLGSVIHSWPVTNSGAKIRLDAADPQA
jgi:hypothetical protein